jgi:hypothetical protein
MLISIVEFDKMQIPLTMDGSVQTRSFSRKLVWRLLEFAFLCAYFGGRTFYFGGYRMKIPYTDYCDISSFLEDVAKCCLWEMTEETKQKLQSEPNPILYHFGIGGYIRNEFLYPQKKLIPSATAEQKAKIEDLIRRADDYSLSVIECIIEKINRNPNGF